MSAKERKGERQARWDREHMRTVSTKLREGEAAHFKELAGFYGVTRYEVLQGLLRTWMAEMAKRKREFS